MWNVQQTFRNYHFVHLFPKHKDTILYAVAGVNITQLTEVNQLSVVAIMAIEKRENISLESLVSFKSP